MIDTDSLLAPGTTTAAQEPKWASDQRKRGR